MRFLPLLLLVLLGCTAPGTVTIRLAPAWQQPSDARPITGYEVSREALALAPTAQVSITDSTYTRISHTWFEAYVSWTWDIAKVTGLRYTPESFDCENFASLFNEIVRKKAADAGIRTAPLLARIFILYPDGRAHALVAVATDRGIFIVEPQPDAGPFRIKPLSEFKDRVTSVQL
jgi:hypothetical protein